MRGKHLVIKCLLCVLFLISFFPLVADETFKTTTEDGKEIDLDVPYVPTPEPVVEAMLKLAEVKKGDVVYDLGCGDGRIVVTAAKKYGVKGIGIDLDPDRVKESKENVKQNKVENLVTIKEGNVLKTDVSKASVVTLYLFPHVNLLLRPILQKQLKPGSRIVSHAFDMGDWEPEKQVTIMHEDRSYDIYLWRIPEKGAKKKASEPEKKETSSQKPQI